MIEKPANVSIKFCINTMLEKEDTFDFSFMVNNKLIRRLTSDAPKSKKKLSSVLRSASASVNISPMYSATKVPFNIFEWHLTPKPFTESSHSNTSNGSLDPR